MLKKFWPSLLALALLLIYIAWLGAQINRLYDAPVAPSPGEPVEPEIDLGETSIPAGKL